MTLSTDRRSLRPHDGDSGQHLGMDQMMTKKLVREMPRDDNEDKIWLSYTALNGQLPRSLPCQGCAAYIRSIEKVFPS